MLAAPLLAGNDLRDMTPEIRDILTNREVIAVDQDKLGKGGPQNSKGVTLRCGRGLSGAVRPSRCSIAASESEMSVKWADAHVSGAPQVRDLWAHADLGRKAGWVQREGGSARSGHAAVEQVE